MFDIFGEQGRHARSAIGVAALPRNAPVELEVIAAVRAR
jgi:Endoribonuclease L-PSP.